MTAIDLNSDLGESYGAWAMGDDEAMLAIVSSANVACGFHAGDPVGILKTVKAAAERGVSIGAHVSYPDRVGFGRRDMDVTSAELTADVIYQIGALKGVAAAAGVSVGYVKPHGALYMEMAVNPELAQIFVQYMRTVAPNAYVLCMAGAATERAAIEVGQPVVREFYADRDYDESGSIVFTRDVGRPDAAAIARKVVRACTNGTVTTVTGKDIDIPFESICFHSDTLGALDIVRQMREALVAEGIRIAPLSEIIK